MKEKVDLVYLVKKKNKAAKLREEEYFSKQKIKIKKINEFQRIPTIPSKIQEFGFDILDNGSLVQKQNPDMYKTFSGEKGDTVGPGSYEIEKPSNWRKTGTDNYKTGRLWCLPCREGGKRR